MEFTQNRSKNISITDLNQGVDSIPIITHIDVNPNTVNEEHSQDAFGDQRTDNVQIVKIERDTGILIQLQNEHKIVDNTSEKLAYEFLSKFPYNLYSLNFNDIFLENQYRRDRQNLINNMNIKTSVLIGILCILFLITEILTILGTSSTFNFAIHSIYIYATWIPQILASILACSYFFIGKSKSIAPALKKWVFNIIVIIVFPFIIVNVPASSVRSFPHHSS